MTLRPCSHEPEIKALLERGHWPQASSPELQAHAAECRSCGDLVLVTQAFHGARASALSAANLPAPGVLWWRAQLRRRNEALERMNKPILGAQIFALAATLLTVVGLTITQASHGLRWLSWFASSAPQESASPSSQWTSATLTAMLPSWNLTLLVPALAMLALLGGVVVYLASEKQ